MKLGASFVEDASNFQVSEETNTEPDSQPRIMAISAASVPPIGSILEIMPHTGHMIATVQSAALAKVVRS
jgi:hypothetical protein